VKKSKAQKRKEALIRQKRYDSLSKEEKLFQIEMRQGESKKEANRILKPTSTDALRLEQKLIDAWKQVDIPNDTGFEMMKDEEKEGWDKHNAKLTTKTPKYREVQAIWDKEMRARGQDGDKHTDWRKSLSESKKEQSK